MVSKARRNSSLPRELSLVLSRHSHAKRCQKLCVGKGEKSTHAPFYEKSIGFRFDHKSHSFLAPSTRTIEPSVRDPTLVGGGRLRIFLASIAKTATRLTSLRLLGRGGGGALRRCVAGRQIRRENQKLLHPRLSRKAPCCCLASVHGINLAAHQGLDN